MITQKLKQVLGTVVTGSDDGSKAQRTAVAAFAVRLVSALFIYAMQVVFARILGGFEYGIFVFVWAVVTIAGNTASSGFPLSLARFIPEYQQKGQLDLLRGVHRMGRLVPFFIATGTALVLAALILLFPGITKSYFIIPLLLGFICIPAYSVIDVHDGMGRAHGWILLALVPPYILRPFFLLLLMLGAYVAGYAPTATTAMYCAIGSTWLTALLQTLATNRKLSGVLEPGPTAKKTMFWIKVSLPICLVDGFFVLMTNTDVLVLSYFRSPEETGAYFAAVKTLTFISFVLFAVAAASAHKFSEYFAGGERDRLETFVRQSVIWTFWPSLAGTAIILALGKPVLWLFGAEFVAAYPVMFIVAFGLLVRSGVGPLERLLNVTGHEKMCARIYFFAFVANLALNLILVPSFGIMGAAIATSAAYVTESFLLAAYVQRTLGLRVMIWHRPSRA